MNKSAKYNPPSPHLSKSVALLLFPITCMRTPAWFVMRRWRYNNKTKMSEWMRLYVYFLKSTYQTLCFVRCNRHGHQYAPMIQSWIPWLAFHTCWSRVAIFPLLQVTWSAFVRPDVRRRFQGSFLQSLWGFHHRCYKGHGQFICKHPN